MPERIIYIFQIIEVKVEQGTLPGLFFLDMFFHHIVRHTVGQSREGSLNANCLIVSSVG